MPSSATTRNRFEKQGTGENTNTWGSKLNSTGLDLIDEALDGYESIAITGNYTLTSTNYASDQARKRFLKFTGSTAANITLPAVSKLYFVWNATSQTLTFTTGGATTAAVAAGAKQWVVCDGSGVYIDTSATSAASSATAAASSASAAATSATNAASSATAAASSASSASSSATSAANSATAAAASAASVDTSNFISVGSDPNADRIVFWDDSAGAFTYLAPSTGLTISGTSLTIDASSTAEVRAASGSKPITPTNIADALAFVTVTYGTTTTVDMSAGVNFRCTLTGNITSFTLSNVTVGKTIEVEVVGNSSTTRSISFHSNFKGDLPTLSDITSTKGYALTIKAMTSTQWNVVSRRSL